MAEITFESVWKRYPDGFEAVKDDGPRDRRRGVHDPRRPVGLREVDGAADDRRARGHHRRRPDHRRRAGQRPGAARSRHRDGVPELRAVSAHDRAREHGLRAQARQGRPRPRSTRKVERGGATSSTSSTHLDRKPANLSGGQRQRVAMGRAIVRDPKAFLMDEPLSNLDAKLRVQMRTEVARIQQRLGTTTVYVTHDQTEAMTLGDRVAVMRAGVIQQVDTPKMLYEDPANLFVAGFIGSPAMNFLPGAARGRHGQAAVRRRAAAGRAAASCRADGKARDVIAGMRPEHFEDAAVGGRPHDGMRFKAKVDVVESMGSELYAYFDVEGARRTVRPARRARRGRRAWRTCPRGGGQHGRRAPGRPQPGRGRRGGRARARHHPDQAVRPRRRPHAHGETLN